MCLKHIFVEDNLHVSPLERAYKTKVLAHYPDNIPTNSFDASAVSMVIVVFCSVFCVIYVDFAFQLCLPNGLKFRTQKHTITQTPTFHSFLITKEDGRRCYGFSLVFYEEVRNRDICNAMQTLQVCYKLFLVFFVCLFLFCFRRCISQNYQQVWKPNPHKYNKYRWGHNPDHFQDISS